MDNYSGNREALLFVVIFDHGAHGFSSSSKYTLNPEGPHDLFPPKLRDC